MDGETLLIRLDAGDTPEWQLVDRLRNPLGPPQRGDLDAAARLARGRRVVVAVPAARCMLTTVKIPAKRRQQLLQALPFALEERVVGDVGALHLTIGDRLADGSVPVVAVDRATLSAWISALDEAGIEVSHLLPEVLLLPRSGNGATAAQDGSGMLLIRTGDGTGLVLEPDALDGVDLGEDDDALDLLDTGDAEIPAPARAFNRVREEHPLTTVMALQAVRELPINLLHGEFRRRSEAGWDLGRWRMVSMLAAAVLVLELATQVGARVSVEQDLERTEGRMRAVCNELIGQASCRLISTEDILTAVNSRISRSGGEEQRSTTQRLLAMASALGDGQATIQGTRIAGVSLRGDGLEVAVSAQDIPSLESLRRRMERDGYQVELGGVSTRNDRVDGRLTVRGGP